MIVCCLLHLPCSAHVSLNAINWNKTLSTPKTRASNGIYVFIITSSMVQKQEENDLETI